MKDRNVGKNPAFQFYPSDWTRDLDDYPLEIEGAWIRICCRLWWSETPGQLTKTLKEWARILRKTEKKTKEILQFLIGKHISNGHNLDNQNITIISRRMMEDDRICKIRREVGKLGGNPQLKKTKKDLVNQTDNQKPTPSSSSSSSSSSSYKQKKIYKRKVLNDEEWKEEILKLHPWINWDDLNCEMDTWLLNNPKRQKTRQFITNWILNKQKDKPIEVNKTQKEIKDKGGPEWIKKAIAEGWK